jgi:hypothetical protein
VAASPPPPPPLLPLIPELRRFLVSGINGNNGAVDCFDHFVSSGSPRDHLVTVSQHHHHNVLCIPHLLSFAYSLHHRSHDAHAAQASVVLASPQHSSDCATWRFRDGVCGGGIYVSIALPITTSNI